MTDTTHPLTITNANTYLTHLTHPPSSLIPHHTHTSLLDTTLISPLLPPLAQRTQFTVSHSQHLIQVHLRCIPEHIEGATEQTPAGPEKIRLHTTTTEAQKLLTPPIKSPKEKLMLPPTEVPTQEQRTPATTPTSTQLPRRLLHLPLQTRPYCTHTQTLPNLPAEHTTQHQMPRCLHTTAEK